MSAIGNNSHAAFLAGINVRNVTDEFVRPNGLALT